MPHLAYGRALLVRVTYAWGNLKVKWQRRSVRSFEDAAQAAHAAGASDPGAYAMSALQEAYARLNGDSLTGC